MPSSEEEAYCPSCKRLMSVGDLRRLTARKQGFFARLFKGGRSSRTA